ncbi:hypothetical protein OROMI_019773 [Orobanche minor]
MFGSFGSFAPLTTTSMFKSTKGDQYYVKGPRMYMVKDDLTVAPLSMISYFSTINEQKVRVSDVGELVLHIGLEEALSILKATSDYIRNPGIVLKEEETFSDWVLYAEADSHFVDVLLSFLTLPLGTIIRILGKHYGDDEAPVIGSLTTMYNGLANLDTDHFSTAIGKQMLLNPRKSFRNECCRLKLNVDDTQPTKAFTCADKDCIFRRTPNIGLYFDTYKCDCGKSALNKYVGGRLKKYDNEGCVLGDDEGDDAVVFTERAASFIISDDLQMLPSETGYAVRILTSLGITSTDGTELRNVTFGSNKVMDLLKGSLVSQTPLTDLILKKRRLNSIIHVKCDACALSVDQLENQGTSTAKRITVKTIMQESTNRLSIQNVNDDKYLKTQDIKIMLLEPELPLGYISKSNILPLNEERLNYRCRGLRVSSVKSPKGPENYVKKQKMFMVTDDLTVTPFSTASSISIINRLNVPLSDVKELELDIGLKEALGILRASLTSARALTDGLMIKPTLKKKPKWEHS